ncbi:efflux transporter, RND family, MFP subunit [Bordetella holmesii CDC-H635-BH]|uniref:Efflux transporter, RND family, MFP subunit n=2 Tax=Bordetella holmesii TaxID=35814 RepID=A0A158M4T2_9BORD|nr:efflux transporter, RND family, MFP subunit [Bordetella holmesii H620]KAK83633.1 efflux transporter, RND family, MFP subunit [Bordetella holmesii CDC-H809-BH]KAK86515.1 efflux transporter, RND family, MFP subunit [Bordetella holmesii CDC-H572-BH]KAK91090.1 efflux transporter, RND family, MFP subunit [Bordetella holmesii CDC-H585-BH]KAL00211.1 efflux transporter, RND family, MFP subunit [Bordetella holmesii CDC-H635-BH]KCV02192.1 efflux transporter, RND family, MFP subunit [Bordetella holmes
MSMKANSGRFKRYVWIAVGLLAAALLIKWLVFPGAAAPTFATATVKRGDLENSVLASGTLEAVRQVSVGAQVSGQLKSLKVKLGDEVKQGQLIAEIDDMTQQNELRNAQAALETRRAELRAKQATLKQAEQAYARQRKMLAADASSRESYESAEATLHVTRADIVVLQAQIAQAEIEVDKAKVNLGYTRIVSPMDGKVVAVVTKEGQTVNSIQSAPTIIKVAQVGTMTVKAQISEADVTRVHPGQKVYFTILGEPDTRHYGVLRAIEPAPDSIQRDESTSALTGSSSTSTSSAVYYNGLFDVPNPDEVLRISMTAQVFVVLGEASQVLQIPSSALGKKDEDGRYWVRVVGKDGQPQERQIRVGMNNNVMAEVLDGLSEGESVVSADSAPMPAGRP